MDDKRRLPLWISNLIVFGLLFFVVVVYFFWQINQAKKAFLDHVNEHAQLVAEVIQLNARSAVFSQDVTEEIMRTFLGSTSRFVDYLDSVESFTTEELTAFAAETNLSGISIYGDNGISVSGPPQWDPDLPSVCNPAAQLQHLEEQHLYTFSWPRQEGNGCVLIGMAATPIESLQSRLGLERLSETLEKLPGICFVQYNPMHSEAEAVQGPPEVMMVEKDDSQVAEFRLYEGNAEIVVGMCTDYLALTIDRIWKDFYTFSIALALLGGILSFLLYRQQSAHLAQVRDYERRISAEREHASLGRAAASIAHEIRNPLNALMMGLQRLQIEGNEITPEHQHLVDLMLDAVRRTNGIVGSLLNFAGPQVPEQNPMRFDLLINDLLDLYLPRCEELGIQVKQKIEFHDVVSGDHDLLHQAVENLIKNAIEAQPDGGFLNVTLGQKGPEIFIQIENSGFTLRPSEAERIIDPYFTTKTTGTGLGLSIAKRIIKAHNGHLDIQSINSGTIEITIRLPLSNGVPETPLNEKGQEVP